MSARGGFFRSVTAGAEKSQKFVLPAAGATWNLTGTVLLITKVAVNGRLQDLANFTIGVNQVTANFDLSGATLAIVWYL